MINQDFKSILDLLKAFPDEQSCIDHLTELRWGGEVVSPFDPSSKVYVCKGNKYRCKNTGKYFNVKTDTLFDNSKVKLQKWFLAIWIVTSHKKGISSVQLSKDIDVTQKTAWFMLQRIRNCFGIDNDTTLDNEVEVDETYVGGETKNKSIRKRIDIHKHGVQTGMNDKAPVLGMIERGGNVRAMVIEKSNGKVIKPLLNLNIKPSAHVITDGFGAYSGINKKFFHHSVINHNLGQYVNGRVHTNTIEGFWSLLKRGILGIYHFTSKKHLQKYVDEFVFRYNSREASEAERFNMMLANTQHRLTYIELINE
ncbi:MAG: IS1595 family transposase [Fluviicola sp.]